jgi:hypothetical protein
MREREWNEAPVRGRYASAFSAGDPCCFGSGFSVMVASVSNNMLATETAF